MEDNSNKDGRVGPSSLHYVRASSRGTTLYMRMQVCLDRLKDDKQLPEHTANVIAAEGARVLQLLLDDGVRRDVLPASPRLQVAATAAGAYVMQLICELAPELGPRLASVWGETLVSGGDRGRLP
jgi:hypothetical protein